MRYWGILYFLFLCPAGYAQTGADSVALVLERYYSLHGGREHIDRLASNYYASFRYEQYVGYQATAVRTASPETGYREHICTTQGYALSTLYDTSGEPINSLGITPRYLWQVYEGELMRYDSGAFFMAFKEKGTSSCVGFPSIMLTTAPGNFVWQGEESHEGIPCFVIWKPETHTVYWFRKETGHLCRTLSKNSQRETRFYDYREVQGLWQAWRREEYKAGELERIHYYDSISFPASIDPVLFEYPGPDSSRRLLR